jgi:capsular exopolysaccharide synthesis family protein
MANINKPLHSLLITSARLGEGKTFIASNLAISIAQSGKRVILVDTDLRRPHIHKSFGIRPEPGFTNLVVEEELDLTRALQQTRVPNLRILPSGTLSPNPAELLSSDRASALIQTLAENADIVIYDSSPATTVTDAVIIASQVDGVVQVVNARGTRMELVLRCKELLERSGARIIGPVLNRVATADLGYYSNYYKEVQQYMAGRKKKKQGVDMWWPSIEPVRNRRPRGAGVGRTSETKPYTDSNMVDHNVVESNGHQPGNISYGPKVNGESPRPDEEK